MLSLEKPGEKMHKNAGATKSQSPLSPVIIGAVIPITTVLGIVIIGTALGLTLSLLTNQTDGTNFTSFAYETRVSAVFPTTILVNEGNINLGLKMNVNDFQNTINSRINLRPRIALSLIPIFISVRSAVPISNNGTIDIQSQMNVYYRDACGTMANCTAGRTDQLTTIFKGVEVQITDSVGAIILVRIDYVIANSSGDSTIPGGTTDDINKNDSSTIPGGTTDDINKNDSAVSVPAGMVVQWKEATLKLVDIGEFVRARRDITKPDEKNQLIHDLNTFVNTPPTAHTPNVIFLNVKGDPEFNAASKFVKVALESTHYGVCTNCSMNITDALRKSLTDKNILIKSSGGPRTYFVCPLQSVANVLFDILNTTNISSTDLSNAYKMRDKALRSVRKFGMKIECRSTPTVVANCPNSPDTKYSQIVHDTIVGAIRASKQTNEFERPVAVEDVTYKKTAGTDSEAQALAYLYRTKDIIYKGKPDGRVQYLNSVLVGTVVPLVPAANSSIFVQGVINLDAAGLYVPDTEWNSLQLIPTGN